MNENELHLMQNYPLDLKIEKTKLRIREWYEHFNGDVYVSFSGGKDSTVLLHIVRSMYPDVEAVFSNTGLEFPEIVQFVKKQDNVTIIRPEKSFKQVIEEKGYPVISKAVSNCIRLARNNIKEGKDTLRVRQIRGLEVGSQFNKGKYEYLLDAPFKISEQCCDELKKKPLKKWEKENKKVPIVGIMADEGGARRQAYLKTGCNAFNSRVPMSKPLGFWKEQDILQYIKEYNLDICSIYGDVIEENGQYRVTGEKRTGCIWCPLGVHLEKEPNRFQRLKQSHPKLYDYCINKLNMGEVLNYMNVKY